MTALRPSGRPVRLLNEVLTICAAGHGVSAGGLPSLLVCGRPPGHDGLHHDVQWAVEWAEPVDECRCGCGRPVRLPRYGLALACYKRWVYHGRPDRIPPQRPSRAGRVEDYLELRGRGLTQARAAARLGVTLRTTQRYEHDLVKAAAS